MKIEGLTRYGCENERKCMQFKARIQELQGNWHPEVLFYVENGQLLGWDFYQVTDREIFNTMSVVTQLAIHQRLMNQDNLKEMENGRSQASY